MINDQEPVKLTAINNPPLPKRTPQEVSDDFDQLCKQAGDLQFKLKLEETRLEQMNGKLLEIAQEFKRASEAQQAIQDESHPFNKEIAP